MNPHYTTATSNEFSDTPEIASDKVLETLNQKLEAAVKTYLPGDAVKICFDMPDPDTPPTQPTVSLFLYGIQEDLELRTGITRQFNNGAMAAGQINIKCDYLITYWEAKPETAGYGITSRYDSPALITMNQVLNALVNNRELKGMPGAYTRVITPQELGNLSHFWQALGNKPRLCLNYSVTVPLRLTDLNETYDTLEAAGWWLELQKSTPEKNSAINNIE